MTLTGTKPKPTNKSNSCPICGDVSGKCRTFADKPLVLCMVADFAPGWKDLGSSKDDLWRQFVPDTGATFDRDDWQRRKREEKSVAVPQTMNSDERDRFYRQIVESFTLEDSDRECLKAVRHMSDRQIEKFGAFSYRPNQKLPISVPKNLPGVITFADGSQVLPAIVAGIYFPIPNERGQWQGLSIRFNEPVNGRRYGVCSTGKNPYNLLNSEGEQPIAVHFPIDQEPTGIAFTEGVGFKPFIAAQRTGKIVIGCSGGNFAGSAKQIKSALEFLCDLNEAWHSPSATLYPDAGSPNNKHITHQYEKAAAICRSLGYDLLFAWWGQVTKEENDIDEASAAEIESARRLSWIEFEAIAETHLPATPQAPVKLSYEAEVEQVQKKLNTLTYQPTTELNQRFLGELALPAPGTITVVSSACKTGKTEGLGGFVDESGVKQFDGIIDKHRAAYPDAHVLMIGHRTVLLKQSAKRLGITHIQGLRGKGYRAIQNTREIALCLDSLDKIDIDSIPPNSLIILDEGDAILRHGVEGGTLKARQEEILGLFQKTINKVLSDRGMLLPMEDDITDLSIDTLKDLTGNRYPVDLTVNRFQASHWDVSIGDGSKSGVTKRVVDCLSAGERLIVPTSAQIYGEELDLIIQRKFEGAKRIVRLDSKTVETLHALVDDPKAWLKDAGVDLLIYTSTAESGFNIPIDVFDRMIAYFVSAGTREHIQFLERYRLDVPREIFCRKFSNFGDGTGRSLLPANILKDWKLLTRQTAMVNRVEKSLEEDANLNPELSQRLERFKSPSEQQEIWNQVAANFKARTNGASAAMLERLTTALIDRGHDVTPTKWQKDDRFKELHKQARQEIDLYGAIKFGGCDTSGTHIDDARVTLNSGTATQEQRLIAYKRVMQDELPGAPLDNTEFVLKAIIENSGRLKKQTDFLFLCQNSDVASFLDKRAFKSQLDKPFMMLRRFRHNRVKVDLMAGIFDKLMAIAHSDSYRESDELVQAVKLWAVKNAFEIKRVLGSKVTEEQTAIYIVNELLRKLGFQKEAIKQEGSGRKGQKRSRIWKVIDADCPHRQEILKALRLKWEKEFSKSAHTILNTKEPLNKIVCATAEIPSTPDDLADWRTPDQRELIKEWWAIAKLDPEQARFIKSHVPIEILEWAIA